MGTRGEILDSLKRIEEKLKQMDCPHPITSRCFIQDGPEGQMAKKCWDCKKVFVTFENELDYLEDRNETMAEFIKNAKERIGAIKGSVG